MAVMARHVITVKTRCLKPFRLLCRLIRTVNLMSELKGKKPTHTLENGNTNKKSVKHVGSSNGNTKKKLLDNSRIWMASGTQRLPTSSDCLAPSVCKHCQPES